MIILVIPTLDLVTGLLPPGTHLATWRELVAAFGAGNFKRKQLVEGLEAVRDRLYEIDLWRFPSPQPAGPLRTVTIKQYFEVTRDGTPKGIVELIREKP